ncbi:MAG: hypothetical protein WCO56_02775 [Verrucomicrobiota bacterium]
MTNRFNSATSRWRLLILSLGILCVLTMPTLAARFLHLIIVQSGQTNLQASYSSGDRTPVENVWRDLKEPPCFGSEERLTHITPDPQQTNRAVLTGDITLKLLHVDRVLAQVKLDRLELTRPEGQPQGWHLTAAEVERTAKLAGFSEPCLYLDPMVLQPVLWGILLLVLAGFGTRRLWRFLKD